MPSAETKHPVRIYIPNVRWERGRTVAFDGVAIDDDVEYVRSDRVEHMETALRDIRAKADTALPTEGDT